MASDLLSIASSGAKAARTALDVTAQNIANASTDGYVKRSVTLEEVSSTSGIGRTNGVSLSGVRVSGVERNVDLFRQMEVRRTTSDAQRATTEVDGLENIEAAIEQSGVFSAIAGFESSLLQLASDPVDNSLRTAFVEDARTMAQTLNIASTSLEAAGEVMRFEANAGVNQVNVLTGELARVNLQLTRTKNGSSDQISLLDERDLLLQQLSGYANINTTIASDETVEVRLGGSGGPLLVSGKDSYTLAMDTASDGTISFTLDGSAVTFSAGSLIGHSQAFKKLADVHDQLDTIAANLISVVNAAQASGVDLDGNPGQAMFTGTGAANIAIAFSDGSLVATAPAGAAADSRDDSNLTALRQALDAADPAGEMDSLIFQISSTVASRTITRDALQSIASSASLALQSQAGVDLDQEAVDLIRYQQAFQACGRAMQVATELFDTLVGIG